MARERVRTSLAVDMSGTSTTWIGTSPIVSLNHSRRLINASYSTDDSHPLWMLQNSVGGHPLRGKMDIGGLFDSASVRFDIPSYGGGVTQGPSGWIWKDMVGDVGAFFPFTVPDNMAGPLTRSQIVASIPFTVDSASTRFALGGTAIARSAPARPEASLAVGLYEMVREGVPNVLSKALDFRHQAARWRGGGKDYLNLEFGWKPFVNEVRQVAKAVADQDKILQDLSKHSGQRLRRRYAFPSQVEVTTTSDDFKPWPFGGSDLVNQQSRSEIRTSTKKTWFSGEFVYRVPDFSSISGVGSKARHLLGLDLTPATLWNAAPWTWLGDWMANSGDVLANISAMSADDLVMRYGYLMQETSLEIESRHHGLTMNGAGSLPSEISGSAIYTRKTRVGASPFGFGLTNEDFSPRQWAILGALGMSRV